MDRQMLNVCHTNNPLQPSHFLSLPPGRGGAAEAGQGAGHAQPVRKQRGHEQLGLSWRDKGPRGRPTALRRTQRQRHPPLRPCLLNSPLPVPRTNPPTAPHPHHLVLTQHLMPCNPLSHTHVPPVLVRQPSPPWPCRQPPLFGTAATLGSERSPMPAARPRQATLFFLPPPLPCTPCFSLLVQRCPSCSPSFLPLAARGAAGTRRPRPAASVGTL